jgi:putative lipoic acid-binding regulatory protein
MSKKEKAVDSAGDLIGWSIGTGIKQKPLEELMEFPCSYDFKAVGKGDETFVTHLLERVSSEIGRSIEPREYSIKTSKEGNYTSVTLSLLVTNADEVYRIYAAIKSDERVKYIL